MEEQACSAIAGIKDRLPGFRVYQEIYDEDNELQTDLRKKILLAYMGFIDLAIEITFYYMRGGLSTSNAPRCFTDPALTIK
jgi:hypothetical protein